MTPSDYNGEFFQCCIERVSKNEAESVGPKFYHSAPAVVCATETINPQIVDPATDDYISINVYKEVDGRVVWLDEVWSSKTKKFIQYQHGR